MIIRIFKATVAPELHQEFEMQFKAVSVPAVNSYDGLISVEIGKPTRWNPHEFVMISKWTEESKLVNFVGENLNEAYIPKNLEKYILDYSVTHFRKNE